MKKITGLLILYLFICSFSPESGERFFSAMSRHTASIKTVSGTFEQEKEIKVLNQKVKSSGNFFFSKPGNVRFDYTSPKMMSIIMTSSNIHILSKSGTTSFSLDKQKALSDLAKVMEACMGGDISSIPDSYGIAYINGEGSHSLVIEPKTKSKNNPYKRIELRLSVSDYSIEELLLYEKNDDVTIYRFRGVSTNSRFASNMFKP